MDNNKIIITDWLLKTKKKDIISHNYKYKLINLNKDNSDKIMKNIIDITRYLQNILSCNVAFFGVHIISDKKINFCILYDKIRIFFEEINLINENNNYLINKLCERFLEKITVKFFIENEWIYTGNINNNVFISKNSTNMLYNNVKFEIRDKIRINWCICEEDIILSFKHSYRIIEDNCINDTKENITNNNIPIYLINKETNKRLQFIKYEKEICQDFFIKDKNSFLFNYIDNLTKNKYKNLEKSKVVTAYFCDSILSKENKRMYHFPSYFLHLERNDIRNTIEFNRKYPNNKINDIIKLFEKLFNTIKVDYQYDGLYIDNHNYKEYELPLPEDIRNRINYINKKNKTILDMYTFNGEIKYYLLHSSVINFNVINSFSNIIKNTNFGIKLKQEKIMYYDKPTTYLKNIKSTDSKIIDKWINEIIDQKMVIIFVTNDEKDTSKYEDIKEFFKNKKIGTQCISLKIINKILKDYENKSNTWIYYMNNIIPQIAIKSGLSPKFYLYKDLNSKCFVGIDVSHIPFITNNFCNVKHVSGSVSCMFDNNGYIFFQDYGNIENGEKIIKEYNNIKNENICNEKNTINKILDNIIIEYTNKTGNIPENIIIHRDGFIRDSELDLIHEYFNNYIKNNKKEIKYSVLSILKNIDKKIYLWSNNKAISSPIKAYINKYKKEAYMISSKPFGKDKVSNPFKIKLIYTNNNYTIEKACKDVYLLSFPTHMKGIVKLRLPMTIHYSDESSTNRNRDFLENDIIYNKLLCP